MEDIDYDYTLYDISVMLSTDPYRVKHIFNNEFTISELKNLIKLLQEEVDKPAVCR